MSRIIMLIIVLGLLAAPVYAEDSQMRDSVVSAVAGSFRTMSPFEVQPSKSLLDLSVKTDGEITGSLELSNVPKNKDTKIDMSLSGLQPKTQYVSVYHHNIKCEFEEDTLSNVIHGAFYTDAEGKSFISDTVIDERKKIHSISVRTAKDFKVVSCIKV